MAEFRGFWRYPPIIFLRIIYLAKNMVGGYPRNPRIEYMQFCLHGVARALFFTLPLRGLSQCKYLFKV